MQGSLYVTPQLDGQANEEEVKGDVVAAN